MLYARRVRAVSTLLLLHARRMSIINAVTTLWERYVDAVGPLCAPFKFDI